MQIGTFSSKPCLMPPDGNLAVLPFYRFAGRGILSIWVCKHDLTNKCGFNQHKVGKQSDFHPWHLWVCQKKKKLPNLMISHYVPYEHASLANKHWV